MVRCTLSALLIGAALLSNVPARGQAQQARQVSVVQDLAPIGLAPGQLLRINVLNPHDDEKGPTSLKTVAVRVTVFDAHGNPLAQSSEEAIEPGRFHSFDFNRTALPLAGEPGTGRVQTRAQVHYRAFPVIDRTQVQVWPTSTELIDAITGRTMAVWLTTGFFEVKPSRNPQ
jgi:hypothetical protein